MKTKHVEILESIITQEDKNKPGNLGTLQGSQNHNICEALMAVGRVFFSTENPL